MDPNALFRWDLAAHDGVDGEGSPGQDGVSSHQTAQVTGAEWTSDTAGTALDDQAMRPDEVSSAVVLPRSLEDISAPVLVHALRGSMDAGQAGALVVSHLLATHASSRVATFAIDELLDYRSRRPTMVFERSAFTEYNDPHLALDYLATDAGGVLLLHGSEPDLRWEAFAQAVRTIVERLGVRTTVGVHGIPMGIPHTRPISVTAHGTREGLVDVGSDVFGTVQVPGSAAALMEFRLGQWGHDAMGFAVHVPHYLAQAEYPAAAAELVSHIARVTGAHLDVSALVEAARDLAGEIDQQVANSAEVQALVHGLEVQYDAYQEAAGRSLLAAAEVPTGDELAAQFEEFLAAQSGESDSGGEESGEGDRGERPF